MKPVSVTWRNFRGFDTPTTFELPAITLLIGRNNVGKSSAYAPLLLLKQTLDARDPRTALLGRGSLLDTGPYADYVSMHDIERNVVFKVDPGAAARHLPTRAPAIKPCAIEMTFSSSDGVSAELYRHVVYDVEGKVIVSRTREKTGQSFIVKSPLLPKASSVGRPLREVTELRSGMRFEEPEGFSFSGYGGLILPRGWRENEDRWRKVRDYYNAASELFDVYRSANSGLQGWLRGISYLGPLRSLPQRTYRLAPEQPTDVGREGQHAPEVLFRGRDQEVGERTNEWLVRLGYGPLEFVELGDDYFQMFVRMADDLRINVAHSGVGLSQLLPLLVQGITARPGSMLIAQQPEIHLNPAQQSLMTDFLVELAASNRRVLVESHSEHVLLRLRRRIAEGAIPASDVAVYYFDADNGRSIPRRIEILEDGSIERDHWPSGFFEEQLDDSFAIAIAQSRKDQ
ncbi:MAG: hypothetical protein JWQ32_2001 [Marmoricola sp.]|nr:hypothetical protein [Marmoricola sp.]